MRSVLSISLPSATLKSLKKKAKDKDMTVSAFVLKVIELDMQDEHHITEEDLLAFAEEAKNDVLSGKSKKLRSPEDLLLPELP
jgi:predicted DNA-binding protein